jgi:hypothetical protein
VNDVKHTHEDGPEGAFFGTHTHDGFEHTHDRDEPDNPDDQGESSDTVEPPAPKRQVPVIISGVNHGMRDAEEGE